MTRAQRMGILEAIYEIDRHNWDPAFMRRYRDALALPVVDAERRAVRTEQRWFVSRAMVRGTKSVDEAFRMFGITFDHDAEDWGQVAA